MTVDDSNRAGPGRLRSPLTIAIVVIFSLIGIFTYKRRTISEGVAQASLRVLAPQWIYDASEEDVGGGHIEKAVVKSQNDVSFGSPSQALQTATLMLRIRPRHGRDVILSIDQGQFLCGADGCDIRVRFQGSNPQTFRAFEGTDHNTAVLFLREYERFITGLRKSYTTSIEGEVYPNGHRVFNFNTYGVPF